MSIDDYGESSDPSLKHETSRPVAAIWSDDRWASERHPV